MSVQNVWDDGEFSVGDEVVVNAGMFIGEQGHVDAILPTSVLVHTEDGYVIAVLPSMIEHVSDSELEELGDRVVVTVLDSDFVGEVGWIVDKDELHSLYYGGDVFSVLLESGAAILISGESLDTSPYQDEELEEVPSV